MKKHIQSIYIDTSVVGGYFEEIFSEDTIKFFKRVRKGELILIVSSLLEDELVEAPERVRNLIEHLPESFIEKVNQTNEATQLAEQYVKEKVIGKTSLADCLHIAIATISNADVLVSWNFKHIVNIKRINGYNSVNLKYGYKTLDIRTPKEALNYEEE